MFKTKVLFLEVIVIALLSFYENTFQGTSVDAGGSSFFNNNQEVNKSRVLAFAFGGDDKLVAQPVAGR